MTYCAEVVAGTYQAMGLLAADRPTNWYDPGRFWSGDRLELERGATLGDEIPVAVGTPSAADADAAAPDRPPRAARPGCRGRLRRRRP